MPSSPARNYCGFWLSQKGRYCKQKPIAGSEFCGTHRESTADDSRDRVRCPYGNHTVTRRLFDKHLKICHDMKRKQKEKCHPCYVPGINLDPLHSSNTMGEDVVSQTMESQSEGVLVQPASRRRKLASKYGPEAFMKLVDRIEKVAETIGTATCDDNRGGGRDHGRVCWTTSILFPKECDGYVNAAMRGDRPFSEKHALQQASIIGNMAKEGLLNPDQVAQMMYVEFGAGKGYLSCMLHDAFADAKKILLVDSEAFSKTADRSLRDTLLRRVRMNLADFDISKAAGLWSNPDADVKLDDIEGQRQLFVGYAKHLCGSATDFALRCCSRHVQKSTSGNWPICRGSCTFEDNYSNAGISSRSQLPMPVHQTLVVSS